MILYNGLIDLHSVNPLGWRLALSASDVGLVVLVDQCISKGTIGHCMFI